MGLPEPCLGERCYSPVACGGFGYCRTRNDGDCGAPGDATIAARRAVAADRKRREQPD